MSCDFTNCKITGLADYGLQFSTDVDEGFTIKGCEITGATDAIVVPSANLDTSQDLRFIDCQLNAGSGNIFNEPGTYDPGFLGLVRSINNTYNKAFTPSGAAKIVEHNKYEI